MNSVKRFYQRVSKGLKLEKQESAVTGMEKGSRIMAASFFCVF